MAGSEYLDLRLGDFLDSLSAPGPTPGGGAAAALAVSLAAGLVTMAARRSADSWGDARGVAAQARTLLERTAPLAQSDADAWHTALEALEEPSGGAELEARLAKAAEVPLAIADTAADVAELAAFVAEMGEGTYRGDAAAAAVLAEAGARAAANLVALNLTVTPDDARLVRARGAAQAAEAAAARALDAGP